MPTPIQPITVQNVMDRLPGLDQWLQGAALSSSGYDAQKISSYIPQWVRAFERDTQFRVNPIQVVANNDGTYSAPTSPPGELVLDDGYPYQASDVQNWFRITLRHRPVQVVQRWLWKLGQVQSPILTVPPEWMQCSPKSGQLSLVPFPAGAAGAASYSALALAVGMIGVDTVPYFYFVDYTAGLPTGWQTTAEYADVLLALTSYCGLQVLKDITEAIDAGLSGKNIGAGGISQSFQYSRFETRKRELEADVQAFKSTLVGSLRGPNIIWL